MSLLQNYYKRFVKTMRLALIGALVISVSIPQAVYALPQSEKEQIDENSVDYVKGGVCAPADSSASATGGTVGSYTNPVYDGVGQGPTVILGDDGIYHVYLTSDDKNPFKHLKSKNLVDWDLVSRDTISNLNDIPKDLRNVMWAPDVAKTGDHYTMVFTGGSKGGNEGVRYIGYATSNDAAGPFKYRGRLTEPQDPGGRVLDPHLFLEGDKIYVTHGSSPIAISEINMQTDGKMSIVGSSKELVLRGTWAGHPSTIEQSWLHKIGGWYYMFYSAGHYRDRDGHQEYSVRVARSKNLMGPYNPEDHSRIVLQSKDPFDAPGASTIIQDGSGTYWMIYNAFKGGERRLMLDKLNFENGWPVANNGYPSSTKQDGGGDSGDAPARASIDACCATSGADISDPTANTTGAQGSTAKEVFVFLIGKGLTAKQAAGIVGNLMSESGVGKTKFDLDPKVTNGIGAYGIAQWLYERKTALQKKANYDTLQVQMDFMWHELTTGYKASTLTPIKASTEYIGPNGSVRIFLENYEIPCTAGSDCDSFYNTRKGYADQAYAAFKDLGPDDVGSTLGGGCSGSSDAYIDASGFAWPLVMPKNKISNGCPWPTRTSPPYCHHDGTPAFDLFAPVGTKAVAITDGTIDSINPYRSTGCQSIQFKSNDGWYYWYGHTRTDSETPAIGAPLKAGDYISKVGESVCALNTSPHLHIDRGFPKGTRGGDDPSRDPDFLKIMNELYKNME